MVTAGILTEVQNLDSQQSSLQAEVSSGLAITQPSDNPAVFGQVVELEGQSRQIAQFGQNATTALNLAQASYSGLQSLTQIYDRATQLSALGSGAQGSTANQAYASELDQLIQQTVQVANGQFGSNYLFAGTAVTAAPFTTTTNGQGQIGSVSYVGNASQTAIPLSSSTSVSPSTTGATNAGFATMINNMIAVRDAMNSGDTAALSTAQTNLISSEDVLSSAVAENGAVQLRIQSDQTQQAASSTEIGSLISTQTDADLPSTITKLSQAQLAYQAALETASKVMQISILDYIH